MYLSLFYNTVLLYWVLVLVLEPYVLGLVLVLQPYVLVLVLVLVGRVFVI